MPTQKTTTRKTENPFFNFDATKVMAQFDPARMAGEFAKMADLYHLPRFDADAAAETQRRNLDALGAANRAFVAGAEAIAKRQAEIVEQSLETAKAAFGNLGGTADPRDAAVKQSEFAKDAFETAVRNSRELVEIFAKSNAEASRAITGRIAESLDEIKELGRTPKA